MTSVRLREAGAADAPVLARLLREGFEEYRGKLDPPSSAHGKTAEAVLRELEGGGALLAEVEGAHAGYAQPTFVVLQKVP
jgi:hypothetical protein